MKTVFIIEDLVPPIQEKLHKLGDTSLTIRSFSMQEDLSSHISTANGIITRRDLSDSEWSRVSNLQLFHAPIAGLEIFNFERMQKNGIFFADNGGANAESVAEHVLLLALTLNRQFMAQELHINKKRWNCLKRKNRELAGQVAGIIGLGRIGLSAATKLEKLGMNIQYCDIEDKPVSYPRVSLEQLLESSDLVSVHVPKTPSTTRMLTDKELSLMKSSSILINTARGGIVCESSLASALQANTLYGAGVDVFESEPLPSHHPFFHLPNIVLTPHTGPSTETYIRLVDNLVTNLMALVNGTPFHFEAKIYP
jgi:phosphoglycerate dehydrogenase-like enzyme